VGGGGNESGNGGSEGGSGGGGGGGGDCIPTTEACLNGIDDDCDNAIDCDDSDCTGNGFECVNLPMGLNAKLVRVHSSAANCDMPLVQVQLVNCDSCSCAIQDDEFGTCEFGAALYDNGACNGTPTEFVVPTDASCIEQVNFDAANSETVGAEATSIGAGDQQCDPISDNVQANTMFLCELSQAGFCTSGESCAPEDLNCMLLDGDAPCKPPFSAKQLVFDSTATDCDCDCSAGDQTCEHDDQHYHVYEPGNGTCNGGGPNREPIFPIQGCVDTEYVTAGSLDAHDVQLDASQATCLPGGEPDGTSTTYTLCCQP